MEFLSTLSLRRATRRHRGNDRRPIDFYPRSPCGERQSHKLAKQNYKKISIHALLAESDRLSIAFKSIICLFLSTLSLRRATNTPIKAYNIIKDFYPRSPCGERLHGFLYGLPKEHLFLSTLSLRRATTGRILRAKLSPISIHALLAESD